MHHHHHHDDGTDLKGPAPVEWIFEPGRDYCVQAGSIWADPDRTWSPGWLLIKDGRVAGGGEGPPLRGLDAVPVDLAGQAVVPGFVDVHVHLDMDAGGGLDLPAKVERCARAGIAAVRDGGDRDMTVLHSRPLVQQRMMLAASGVALHAPGKYGKWIGRAVGSRDDMRRAVADLAAAGANQIKVMASGLVSLEHFGQIGPVQFDLADLRFLVELAWEQGLPVMAHANGPEAVSLCARAGVASVEHGYFMGSEAMARLLDAGVFWSPTIVCLDLLARRESPNSPRREVIERTLAVQVGQLAMACDMGLNVATGTDMGSPGLEAGPALRQEMVWWLKAGFSGRELLNAATAAGAGLLGLSNEIGSLTPAGPPFWSAWLRRSPWPMRSPVRPSPSADRRLLKKSDDMELMTYRMIPDGLIDERPAFPLSVGRDPGTPGPVHCRVRPDGSAGAASPGRALPTGLRLPAPSGPAAVGP